MSIRLMMGDCLERMGEIPDGSVDAVVTDPPYGMTDSEWDVAPDWPAWWTEAKRVCKPNAFVVVFTQMPAALDLVLPARRDFKYDLVGHKNLATGHLNANRCPMRNHELVYVFAFGSPAYNRCDWQRSVFSRMPGTTIRKTQKNRTTVYGQESLSPDYTYNETECPKSVFPMKRKSNFRSMENPFHHPNAKPVAAMEWLVKGYSPEGGAVLDSWTGSGTTGVACVNTGRNFIGIERDPGYFAIAERRIAEAAQQKGAA